MNKLCAWFGHKYRPRFDLGPSTFNANVRGCDADELGGLVDKYRQSTYVRDVCARCGATIERTHDANGREIPQ